ncbi:ArsR family transcriptional regulator [uncultured Ferrimonas sp.]|uniref:ArsR family transcriptional regulator n=1 Tax=uncultured Ferrimonas sp. TaxID=432640 RepID=UPI0026059E1D|nr:ArsR family transcriptional regulator [uncultured Ferrimonas sp.]
MTVAVISGDIVSSRQMSTPELDTTLALVSSVLAHYDTAGTKHHFFRGDGFQITLPKPSLALRCALQLKLTLIGQRQQKQGSDCRLAIGVGEISQLRRNGATSSGEAFELSGLGLDSLKGNEIALFSSDPTLAPYQLLLQWLSFHLQGLTPKQAQVLQPFLFESVTEQSQLAQRLGLDQSTVSRHLSRAGAPLLQQLLSQFEQVLKDD